MDNRDTLQSGLPAIRKIRVVGAMEDRWARQIRNSYIVGPLRSIFDIECTPEFFEKPIEEKVRAANELNKARSEASEGEFTPYIVTEDDYTIVMNKIEQNHKLMMARNIIFFKLFGGSRARQGYILMWEKAKESQKADAMSRFLNYPLEYGYRIQKLMNLEEVRKNSKAKRQLKQAMELPE